MLVDQKMNDGSPLPFFGHNAMTATAPAAFAVKYQVPVLVARVVRTDGAHFHVTIDPPMHLAADDDAGAAAKRLARRNLAHAVAELDLRGNARLQACRPCDKPSFRVPYQREAALEHAGGVKRFEQLKCVFDPERPVGYAAQHHAAHGASVGGEFLVQPCH